MWWIKIREIPCEQESPAAGKTHNQGLQLWEKESLITSGCILSGGGAQKKLSVSQDSPEGMKIIILFSKEIHMVVKNNRPKMKSLMLSSPLPN